MKLILKDKLPVLKFMTKGDFFLIAGIVILVGFLFLKPYVNDEKPYAEIYLDSQKVHKVDFESTNQSYELNVGGCVILVEKDGVSFLNSSCPDRLCVKSMKMSRTGDTMACVPEKVVVVIKSDKTVLDAVSY